MVSDGWGIIEKKQIGVINQGYNIANLGENFKTHCIPRETVVVAKGEIIATSLKNPANITEVNLLNFVNYILQI